MPPTSAINPLQFSQPIDLNIREDGDGRKARGFPIPCWSGSGGKDEKPPTIMIF